MDFLFEKFIMSAEQIFAGLKHRPREKKEVKKLLVHSKITIEDMDVSFFYVPAYNFSATDVKTLHYHLNYEVHHLFCGELSYIVENKTYKLDADSVLLIPPNTLHQPSCESDYATRFSFEFAISKNNRNTGLYRKCRKLLEDNLSQPNLLNIHIPELMELHAIFQGRYGAEKQLQSVTDNLIVSYLGIIFSKLLLEIMGKRNVPENRWEISHTAELSEVSPRGVYISQYITNNYNNEPSIGKLADELHLSVRQTERLLKNEMNTSFSSLLNRHRVRLACYIIRTSVVNSEDKTFEEISNQLGFGNYHTFLKQFKLYTGESPTQYRRMYSEFVNKNRNGKD